MLRGAGTQFEGRIVAVLLDIIEQSDHVPQRVYAATA